MSVPYEFSADERHQLQEYFTSYGESDSDTESQNHLTLENVCKVFDREFGIQDVVVDDLMETIYSKTDTDQMQALVELVKSGTDEKSLPIDFPLFLTLLQPYMVRSKTNVPLETILAHIKVNPDSDVLTISEVKYFYESVLGEKLADSEMRLIFDVVAKGKNEIGVSELAQILRRQGIWTESESEVEGE